MLQLAIVSSMSVFVSGQNSVMRVRELHLSKCPSCIRISISFRIVSGMITKQRPTLKIIPSAYVSSSVIQGIPCAGLFDPGWFQGIP